ncbi:MAG TPA: ATP-binding protein [Acidimicrobiales bacterium]|nr:ATP-binding protein [Acidimicrobiales bacterium]
MTTTQDRLDEERRAAVRQALGALSGLVPFGVIAVDPRGNPWYLSQRWMDLTGARDADRNRPWFCAVHPDDQQVVAARWREAVEFRGRLGEFRVVGPNGTVRRCRGETVAMLGAEGEVTGRLVVVTDASSTSGSAVPYDSPTGADLDAGWPSLATPHLLDVVLDHAQDVITILNADGSWRWSNGGAIRLVGHQEAFDPAEGIFSLVHPEDRQHARALLARAVAGEPVAGVPLELRLRTSDGSWRWMEGSVDSRLDEPAIRGFVVHLHDIQDRRYAQDALEAANRRLVDLIESLQTAVVLEDEDGKVVHANQAFMDLFRLRAAPDSVVGKTLESVGLSAARLVAEPTGAETLLRQLRERAERREGVRAILHDGRTLECDFLPIAVQGTYRGYLSTYRDITGQARAEAERERLLASEREENRRLAELDAYRSESLAAVSHELRTPLTSIVGYTHLLRNTIDATASAEEAAYLDAIARNVDRLLRLAGDVVALDSLESRAMPLPVTEVDVPEVVERAVRTVRPQAADRSIDLSVETAPGPVVHGDEDRLAQLVENLIANAVKFTLTEGRIVVRAAPLVGDAATTARSGAPAPRTPSPRKAGRATPPTWELTVADTGIGIPEDELSMLTTRFFRASNARRRGLPGSGLGLSVARAIAERHGGSLSVSSVVGVGTTVTVRFGDVADEGGGPPPGGPAPM